MFSHASVILSMGGVVLQGMCGGGTYIAGVCVVGDHASWERAWKIGACVVGRLGCGQ